jgi:phosphoglycerate dehydrogenase-like enzyme
MEPTDGIVLVLREGVHGMPMADYAATLTAELPDREVRHAPTPAAERTLVADATVVTGRTLRPELLERADRLRLFAGSYAGYGHLPLAALGERDVAVTTASGVHAPNAAEHVVGGILQFTRGFGTARRQTETGTWRSYHTRELAGSTATVVGLGAIGRAVCERLDAFGVETVGVRRHPEDGGPADTVLGPDRLHDALAGAAAVVLCCPLTDATRGLLGRAEFATMDADAVLVNVARGPVVDTDALVRALRRNAIGGAVLDVTDPEPLPPDHPLWGFDEVLVTPHNAGHTPRYYDRLAELVADNVRRLERDEPLTNRVDPA